MELIIARSPQAAVRAVDGPTPKQARRTAAYRARLLTQAQEALTAGNDERAFERDCEAFDIEADLTRHGFDPDTGARR